jgi:membrane associated rhomboid family serine protease
MSITLYITVVTVIVSVLAFYNAGIMDKLIFHPYSVSRDNEWYRFISCGFIHADFMHLAFNMFSFYMFGNYVEQYFNMLFGQNGKLLYLFLYLSSLAVCLIPTYIQQKDRYNYNSLGASGAVSAIVFAGIFLMPTIQIGFFIIPPIIPGFIFGPIYLGITAYLSKQGRGGINHSAHLWGSLYGVVFLIVAAYFIAQFNIVASFIEQIRIYLGM